MPGVSAFGLQPLIPAGTVVSAPGNSPVTEVPYGAEAIAVIPTVSAYTSGTITYEVQWSFDGTNFFSCDEGTAGGTGTAAVKDTFANITAAPTTVYKVVNVKAPYYRVAYTTGAYTHGINVAAVGFGVTGAGTPYQQEEGASSFFGSTGVLSSLGVQVGYIGSTTLSATYVQGTPATMSAITAVPLSPLTPAGIGALSLAANPGQPISRMSIKLNVSANTWTVGAVFAVVWSLTGVAGSTWAADPTDTFAGATAAFTSIKEIAIKAPYFAIAITAGTPGSATFTADVCATAE